jgi:Mg-chelatase subunit ChlD
MYDELSDSQLDARLRDVLIPSELVARLQQACIPDDAELDTALRQFAPPAGFADRLKSVIDGEALDESLRDVPIPETLLPRLRIIPEKRSRSSLRRFAVAASLLIVTLGSYFGALGGLLAAIRVRVPEPTSLAVIDLGPVRLTSSSMDAVRLIAEEDSNVFVDRTVFTSWQVEPMDVDLARYDETPTTGPAGALIRDVEAGLALSEDVLLMRWDALASPQRSEEPVPELEHIRRAPAAGVDLPLAPGYDRAFLLKSSTHPPVFPAGHQALQDISVPLATAARSFQRTKQLVDQGRMPAASEIRSEDFLSAIDYNFPPPSSGRLAIRTAGGPSVFGRQQHRLLQVGVKAARSVGDSATHVSVVVDVSTSMGRNGRLAAVRDALKIMVRHLGPEDSLSLVAVNHAKVHQIEFANAEHFEEVTNVIQQLQAGGGDNLAGGVQVALRFAVEADLPAGANRQLVLITDGEASLGEQELAQLGDAFALAEESDVAMTVLDLDDRSFSSPDAGSLSSGLRLRRVTPLQIVWELVGLATGESPLIAREAMLRVTFNPRAVFAYRLVGHGPTAVTGLDGSEFAADLYSDQEATALFEIWLRENDEEDVGWTDVRWTDPRTGATRVTSKQRISRVQFAVSQAETPLTLQAAAIAAEVGQRLRGVGDFEVRGNGVFGQRRKPESWEDVLAVGTRVHRRAAERPDFQELLDLVRRIERLRKPNGTPE